MLRRINAGLLVAIIAINVYILLLPFYPLARLWWENHLRHRQQQLTHLIKNAQTNTPQFDQNRIPAGEWLIIPRLALDTPVYEGRNIYTANKGVWHRPASAAPDKGGNTVLVGHRFTYTNPTGVFYSLDKMRAGDQIALFWNQKEYVYSVVSSAVVPPTDTSVEAPTKTPVLTLYTCTPLWSAKNRLVVTAERIYP